jgi:peptidoglycan-associated lipoprotein
MYRLLTVPAVLAACFLAAACSSTPIDSSSTKSAPMATPAARTAASPNPAAGSGQGVGTPGGGNASRLAGTTAAAPAERSVYFEFDDATLARQWLDLVERQGQYLSRNAALKVRVEGHTDERGGSEYNLALGQRRAEAVRKALEVYGVKAGQIEAVSFGEERPKASGHDEPAWAQNRRADIAYAAAR